MKRNLLVIVAGLLCGLVVMEVVRSIGQAASIAKILLRDRFGSLGEFCGEADTATF